MSCRSILVALLSAVALAVALPAAASAVVAPPQPIHVPGPRPSVLERVSCPTDTECVATGFGRGTGHGPTGLIERWNGTRWQREAMGPISLLGPDVLIGVSCGAADSCTAVGVTTRPLTASGVPETHGRFLPRPLAVTEVAGRWAPSFPVQQHGGVAVHGVSAIACTKTGGCVAGGYGTRGGRQVGVIETMAHGSWRFSRTIVLPGVSETSVTSVSCARAGSCVADVNGGPRDGGRLAAVYRLRNGHWVRAARAPGGDPWLLSVGCAPDGPCLTIGSDTKTAYQPIGFSVTDDLPTPLPAPPAAAADALVTLDQVACASATQCLGIGLSTTRFVKDTPPDNGIAPRTKTLALEQWNGNSFSPVPTGDLPALNPISVACRPAFCMLVGGNGHATSARSIWTPVTAQSHQSRARRATRAPVSAARGLLHQDR